MESKVILHTCVFFFLSIPFLICQQELIGIYDSSFDCLEFTENFHVASLSADKARTFWSGEYQISNDTLVIEINSKNPYYLGGYHNISMNLPLDRKTHNQFIIRSRGNNEPLIAAFIRLLYKSDGEESAKETNFNGEATFSHSFDHRVDSVIVKYIGYTDYRFCPPSDSLPRTFNIYMSGLKQRLIRPSQDVEIRRMIIQSADTLRFDEYRPITGRTRLYVRIN
jgi:hypothetical protein